VQPPAADEQRERRAGRHQDARLLADPAARRRDHEEEQQADEHREPADPAEHPPAEEVLDPRSRRGHARDRVCRRAHPERWCGRPRLERQRRGRLAAPVRLPRVEPRHPRLQPRRARLQRRHPLVADNHESDLQSSSLTDGRQR
jgi:hypothetical protein